MIEQRPSGTGRGVFATEFIAAGTKLLDYTGPALMYAQTSPSTLAVQVGPDRYLGGSGGLDDLVNHSCDPNAGLLVRGAAVELRAVRDVRADEQVTFDYSTTMDEDDFEFDCLCGSPLCRRRVGDFKRLPIERRRFYAHLGVVPDYNLKYL